MKNNYFSWGTPLKFQITDRNINYEILYDVIMLFYDKFIAVTYFALLL